MQNIFNHRFFSFSFQITKSRKTSAFKQSLGSAVLWSSCRQAVFVSILVREPDFDPSIPLEWIKIDILHTIYIQPFIRSVFAETDLSLEILAPKNQLPYFHEQFPRQLFFFQFNLMYCDLWLQYIQVQKLFKGGNYLRKYGMYFLALARNVKCSYVWDN